MIQLSLAALSAGFGLIAVLTIARNASRLAISRARKRIGAHFLELRLFASQPRLLFRAQKALIASNARFLLLMLRPASILAVPTVWFLAQLDFIYGVAPLAIGQAVVVTAHMNGELRPLDAQSVLAAPPEIAVETPPVRIPRQSQISWRIRPLRAGCGSLTFRLRGNIYTKAVCAGQRRVFLLSRRVRPLGAFLLHPEESRLPSGAVESLDVSYPTTKIAFAGIALPWIIWFMLISAISTFVFSRWL